MSDFQNQYDILLVGSALRQKQVEVKQHCSARQRFKLLWQSDNISASL